MRKFASCLPTRRHRSRAVIAALAIAMPALLPSFHAQLHAQSPDAYIGDFYMDPGFEPNTSWQGGGVSRDIYVRHNQDGLQPGKNFDQGAISGQNNWVYVQVHNRSNDMLFYGEVHVYFRKAFVGTSNWSADWVGSYPLGDEIGTGYVYYLPGHTSTTVEIQWPSGKVPVPNVAFNDPNAGHFCLLARLVSAEDPMATAEGTNVNTNAYNNNNIASRNISIMKPGGPVAALDVINARDQSVTNQLHFSVPGAEMGDPLTSHCTITLDLGPDLYALWAAGDKSGENVTDLGGSSIRIDGPDAWIGGIELGGWASYTIHVQLSDFDTDPGVASNVYHWTIAPQDQTTGELLSAEEYEVHMSDADNAPKQVATGVDNTAGSLALSAAPNPTYSAATITYSLPSEGNVGLAIYDAGGRLVRTLLSAAEQGAGAHAIEWDGKGDDGSFVPSGTYLYRLSTAQGNAERQLKIVR
ncbi:MAG: T9SS type A sorting domain-containing protein [Bacteroidetes bacterium]|nr:T9SS type A sorting domain-containing protein [Bacteroidota bacterium]